MAIPKTPCPVGGLVPLMNGIWPIVGRKPHPVLLWLYTIHEKRKDAGLVIHYNVSQEDIVKEIDLFCQYTINCAVQLGATHVRYVVGRKWSFEGGTVVYAINDARRTGRTIYMDQEKLSERIRGLAEEHA